MIQEPYPDMDAPPAELEKLTQMLIAGEICLDTFLWMQGVESALDRLEARKPFMDRKRYFAIKASMERKFAGLDLPKKRRKKKQVTETIVDTADAYFEIENMATSRKLRIPFSSKNRVA